MNRARCPKCKSRIRRSFYRFFCDNCNVELSETQSSTFIVILIGVISFLVAIVIGYFETVEIVNASKDSNSLKELIFFYLKLLSGLTFVSLMIEHIYLKYFASYGDKR